MSSFSFADVEAIFTFFDTIIQQYLVFIGQDAILRDICIYYFCNHNLGIPSFPGIFEVSPFLFIVAQILLSPSKE